MGHARVDWGSRTGAIVPRMPEYRALAEAEGWSGSNVTLSLILLVVVIVAVVWVIRRYLAD